MICEADAGQCAITWKFLGVVTLVVFINVRPDRDELDTLEHWETSENLFTFLQLHVQFDRNIYPLESKLVALDEVDHSSISQCSILTSSKGSQELLTHLVRACDDLGTTALSFLKDKEVRDSGCYHVDKDISHFCELGANVDPDESSGNTTTENYLWINLLYVREELVQWFCLESVDYSPQIRVSSRTYHSRINLVSAESVAEISEDGIHVSVNQPGWYCFYLCTHDYQALLEILRHHFVDRHCFVMCSEDFLDFIAGNGGCVDQSWLPFVDSGEVRV